MTEWLIKMKDDANPFQLKALYEHFRSRNVEIVNINDDYYLRFDPPASALAEDRVRAHAYEFVSRTRLVARFLLDSTIGDFYADGLYVRDGGELHKVVGEEPEPEFWYIAQPQSKPTAEEIDSYLVLVAENSLFVEVLKRFEGDEWWMDDYPEWRNCYRAWKVACQVAGGPEKLVEKGWANEQTQRSFLATAQCMSAIDDQERRMALHECRRQGTLMSHGEAADFVRSVIKYWAASAEI